MQGVTYCNECQDSDGGDKKDDGSGDDEQDGGEV